MPMPSRDTPQEYFDRLQEHQKPHLTALRQISLEFSDQVSEQLRWNTPAYIQDGQNLWMLQAFKNHCSLRFTPDFMSAHHDTVAAAGYETGAGFLKVPYDKPVPEDLARQLMRARTDGHEASE